MYAVDDLLILCSTHHILTCCTTITVSLPGSTLLESEQSSLNNSFSSSQSSSSFSFSDNVSATGALQLLKSVLEEQPPALRHRVNINTGNVAYCPQSPPMHAGSIRSNILMGSAMDEERYQSVLDGCCLLHDLKVGVYIILYCFSRYRDY